MLKARPLIIALVLCSFGLSAWQVRAAPDSSRYDVFLRDQAVIFVDARTALSTTININGDWHTLIGEGVLFRAADTKAALVALPNGDIALHPYIPRQNEQLMTRWISSANGKWLAWAFTARTERGTISDLFVVEGLLGENRMALHTTSTRGLGILPLAISDDGAYVFYTRRTDLFEPLPPVLDLPVESVLRLHVESGEAVPLPDSPDCPCLMAFSPDARRALRLAATADGVTVTLIELNGLIEQPIGALRGYERPHYPVFAADGKKALFRLSRSSGRTRSAIALADFTVREARLLTETLPEPLRPLALTARADTALLLSLNASGTFKLTLADGAIVRVSPESYLGSLP
ncbi:MAG: hypothetical protein CUN49_07760 [Candidatus Thermofonsia Clade 1 bacterium]|jgi:hypothetical protein|uniref:Lipoprotein LpqB beta-propeller domain-containing protein n=1 Tax=Candidatus Thermofonsia Clade 1 bacterium TaxID=2364210 RepID=A0A2M8PEJ2_9CHLR|nr:MAG: hypothetical protein CUN49_07760 [Candidatus Thermofonsia Clade 1 bacterium]RMF50657.1 MAG: hypothetical protein D6749_09965 [Chloroflexota bacterium]